MNIYLLAINHDYCYQHLEVFDKFGNLAFAASTVIGKSTNPRFCENEVKKLHSSTCCRQENTTFYPLIL